MTGSDSNTDGLVEVLKEIRDELRAVRAQLGGRAPRMTTSGIRTEKVDRAIRWRNTALAAGGLTLLAIVLGIAVRERPAPANVAVAPQASVMPAAKSTTTVTPAPAVAPAAQAPLAVAAPAARVMAAPVARTSKPPAVVPAPMAATKQAARSPAITPAIASLSVSAKKRVKPDVARPPAEVAADEDETMTFSPPPRRVRVHRMSYGPVESEPAKL